MHVSLNLNQVTVDDQFVTWIESVLASLQPLARIEGARLDLSYRHSEALPYRAKMRVSVPGPDVIIEVQEHTLRAAVAVLIVNLRSRMMERAARRLLRRLSLRRHALSLPIKPMTMHRPSGGGR